MKKYTSFELNTTVKTLDGKECKIMNDDGTDIKSFTVREAFRRSLGAIFADEQAGQGNPGLSFEKKMKRYEVAKKIWNADLTCELSTEEQSELKKCVGKMFSGEALGFLEMILEGKTEVSAGNGIEKPAAITQ